MKTWLITPALLAVVATTLIENQYIRDKFKCTHCKYECDADLNVAINIRWMACLASEDAKFDKYGNYMHNDYNINLANFDVNCVQLINKLEGGPG